MLVMAPKTALFQWKKAVLKFNIGVKPYVVGFDQDTGKSKTRFHRYSTYENTDADVLLLSYQQMARDIDVILSNIDNFIIAFDEVQTVKNANQKLLYPAANKLSQKARYVWGATATPIMSRLEDLYAVMDVIIPGIFGSLEHFRKTYYEYAWTTVGGGKHSHVIPVVRGYQNLPQLMQFIRPYYIKRPAAVMNAYLPKIVTKDVMMDMDVLQANTYQQIVEKYFPGNEEFKARKLTKLASLTYAQMVADAPEVLSLVGDSVKADELIRLLTEEFFDEKIIVYTRYEQMVSLLSRRLTELKVKHVRITGKEANPLIREQNKVTFNESTDTNVVLINDAGGEAIDLDVASVLIFFDMPWAWGKFQQIIGRARRRSSKQTHILVVLMMVRGTIDEKVYNVLKVEETLVSDTFGIDDSALDPVVLESEGSISDIFEAVRGKVA